MSAIAPSAQLAEIEVDTAAELLSDEPRYGDAITEAPTEEQARTRWAI